MPGWADSGFLGLGILWAVKPLAVVRDGEEVAAPVATVIGDSRIAVGAGDDDRKRPGVAWRCVIGLPSASSWGLLSSWWSSPGCWWVFSVCGCSLGSMLGWSSEAGPFNDCRQRKTNQG